MTALLLCACALSFAYPAIGEEERPPAVRSQVEIAEYPTPVVPESPRAEDSYFANAILVGDSLASGMELFEVFPAMNILYKTGLSPRAVALEFTPFKIEKEEVTLVDYLLAQDPDIVYLWLGLNGIEGSGSSLVLPHYHVMLNLLLEAMPDTLFYIMELTPVRDTATDKHEFLTNKNVNRFNEGLYALAEEHNVYILQYHDLMLNSKGELVGEYASSDGYHLRKTAHELIVDYIYTHTIPFEKP